MCQLSDPPIRKQDLERTPSNERGASACLAGDLEDLDLVMRTKNLFGTYVVRRFLEEDSGMYVNRMSS
jgi:hypothetical protein